MTPIRSGSRNAVLVAALVGGLGGLSVSCTADSVEPIAGSISVVVTTTGSGSDADGYTIGMDGRVARRVAQNETTAFAGLAAGDHRVSISDVSSNCSVQGSEAVTVSLTGSDTVTAEFFVQCESQVGELEIAVVTAGADLDPNGYAVTVDGSLRLSVGIEGEYRVTAEAGDRVVALTGVTPNCVVTADNPRPLRVLAGAVVATVFDVNCGDATPGGHGDEIYFVAPIADEPDESGDFGVQIHVMNADGTGRRGIDGLELGAYGLAWDPLGDRLAFMIEDDEGIQTLVVAMHNGTILWRKATGLVFGDGKVSWSPDGTRLVFVAEDPECFSTRIMVINDDGTNPRPVTPPCGGDYSPAWSPDGRIAFVHEDRLVLMAPDGSDSSSFPLTPANPQGLSWSPDGSRLAFSGDIDVPGLGERYGSEIYTVGADGSGLRRLTGSPGLDGAPSWSPDGSRIVFASERREGNSEIWVMDADGGHPERLTTALSFFESDGSPAWRP